jgi:hypothetical protein
MTNNQNGWSAGWGLLNVKKESNTLDTALKRGSFLRYVQVLLLTDLGNMAATEADSGVCSFHCLPRYRSRAYVMRDCAFCSHAAESL